MLMPAPGVGLALDEDEPTGAHPVAPTYPSDDYFSHVAFPADLRGLPLLPPAAFGQNLRNIFA